MEEKRSSGRSKRQLKSIDDGHWDCSVCTYSNSPEAYKCEMCDVRKGTSTRKPRLNSQLVAQQAAQQFAPPATKREKTHTSSRDKHKTVNGKRRSRLKNIDRSSGEKMEVTVNDVTVLITDYKPKTNTSPEQGNDPSSDTSDTNSSAGNDNDHDDVTSDTSVNN
ncbi:YY1-associated factor 2 [Patella vulgata]|uniref:RanBP2-type domain-containing protein n=1 Tax=Patella caerulea TaxID=87958 RepID=A0AAN8PK24_PATCE|nr:YY1-associated factor 2 [Patella vulgata]